MPDQILTQEEIDALLSAMDKGEVDLAEENKKKTEAVSYSLTTQNIILRDQFYALEEVYDKFVTLMNQMLSSTLQRSIQVEFISAEMESYQEFMEDFSSPTCFQIFGMQPLHGAAMLVIEPGLFYSLIDCMFGGDGKPVTSVREFTMIEQRMINKLTHEILQNLEDSEILPKFQLIFNRFQRNLTGISRIRTTDITQIRILSKLYHRIQRTRKAIATNLNISTPGSTCRRCSGSRPGPARAGSRAARAAR